MEDYKLYEYAVIRLVPKVEREEFFNVGLLMYSKRSKWLRMEYIVKEELFQVFCPILDFDFIIKNLQSFKEIADGTAKNSPIAQLDKAERFRWITAVKSSSIQMSRPHVGVSENLDATFEALFKDLIL